MKCEVLIIDEISLLSAKAFDAIEKICRSIKNNGLIFGGIQVLAAGSFVQLPPVPSVLDSVLFAFQSDMFARMFPHKINLKTVVHQDEVD